MTGDPIMGENSVINKTSTSAALGWLLRPEACDVLRNGWNRLNPVFYTQTHTHVLCNRNVEQNHSSETPLSPCFVERRAHGFVTATAAVIEIEKRVYSWMKTSNVFLLYIKNYIVKFYFEFTRYGMYNTFKALVAQCTYTLTKIEPLS